MEVKIENRFFLNKNQKSYTITIEKINECIIIKCLLYQVKFDKGNISEIFSIKLNNINDEYNYLYNLFINCKVAISEIISNTHMILMFTINDLQDENNTGYIYLIHQSQNQTFIINKYYNKLKNIEKNSILSISDLNIENIQLQEIKCIEAYSINPYYNSFIIFTSPCNNIQYLIFITKNNSIISYNLDTNIILSEIKEFQSQNIMRLDYIFDKKNKRDLLMAYCLLNCIIIYDIRNWNIIISLEKVNDFGVLNSACFLFDKRDEEIFIITSNDNYSVRANSLKIYDLAGKLIKEIKNSNENTFCIKTYYNKKIDKVFIIALNNKYIKSYDYESNTLYNKYYEKGFEFFSNFDIINNEKEVIHLISYSTAFRFILIWNFETGYLLNKIKIEEKFFTFFLYNERILFTGGISGNIIIMDLLSKKTKKIEKLHGNYINCINKFIHKKEGNCLVTQGNDNIIKIFRIISD